MCILAGNIELGKGAKVNHTSGTARCLCLGHGVIVPILMPPADLFHLAYLAKIPRPFPSGDLAKHGAFGSQPIIERVAVQGAQAVELLARARRVMAAHELVLGAFDNEGIAGEVTIAARVKATRVDLGLAVHHQSARTLPAPPPQANPMDDPQDSQTFGAPDGPTSMPPSGVCVIAPRTVRLMPSLARSASCPWPPSGSR